MSPTKLMNSQIYTILDTRQYEIMPAPSIINEYSLGIQYSLHSRS